MVGPRVPFLNLGAEFSELESEWFEALRRIGRRGAFVLGEEVRSFEQEFAEYIGAARGLAVASGTDALLLALTAAGVKPGDEVITSSYSFIATASSILRLGARPVFVDINAADYTLSLDELPRRVTSKTRAVLPVRLFGMPAQVEKIEDMTQATDIELIEDCAQACGAHTEGKRVGSFGRFGCFSFYPTKVLGCYGDGGFVTVRDERDYEKLLRLRNHGAVTPHVHQELGFNSRLDEIQAALLRLKLPRLPQMIERRSAIAAAYRQRFSSCGLCTESVPAAGHVFNSFIIRTPARAALSAELQAAGVACQVFYPRPLHLQPVFRSLGYRRGDFPEAERAAEETLALPIDPSTDLKTVNYVADIALEALAKHVNAHEAERVPVAM